tara:strand:- start:496 stop:600 length:105 start_codon:yes stop_codon:yes gene_type:complete
VATGNRVPHKVIQKKVCQEKITNDRGKSNYENKK